MNNIKFRLPAQQQGHVLIMSNDSRGMVSGFSAIVLSTTSGCRSQRSVIISLARTPLSKSGAIGTLLAIKIYFKRFLRFGDILAIWD